MMLGSKLIASVEPILVVSKTLKFLYSSNGICNFTEFCYNVYNQRESFICLDLMVKNREIAIERYLKWWISTKLVWVRYQNY
jgi:hypothetical protein